ncbi:alpha/beta fold hydrolase [Bacillus sp. HMF5848]|uniref:alpha/beta fold hydrolase n=1 Tax=Bacillus sp. HMF5848 TaxID=2495421 RepID=UPI000F791743|nr:alpha/beta hydrolase [Bacillus sp. HMF5848]RSK28369.1 alpha/beta fold hydrolase [Bacillus sp. HMF5848]
MAFFRVNGYDLYYELLGDQDANECVMFFNGVMTTTASWALYYPLFEKQYKVLLHDFKGQMKSDKPLGPYSFQEHASDAMALMKELGIERAHFIGTSYGAQVALRCAIENPEVVQSLVIIDGTSEIDETTKLFVQGWRELAKQGIGEKFFWGAVPSLYGSEFVEANLEFLHERATMLNQIEADYFKGQMALYDTFINDSKVTEELHKVTCPTLVVYGEEDILTPRKFSEIIVEHIPQAEFAVIPGSGHVTIFEKPNIIQSLMLGFVMKQK